MLKVRTFEHELNHSLKLSDLLNRLVLTERMTTKVEDTERINQQPIDYKKVDDVLQKQREIAMKYLQNNIEG